jgi:hypothetical protein
MHAIGDDIDASHDEAFRWPLETITPIGLSDRTVGGFTFSLAGKKRYDRASAIRCCVFFAYSASYCVQV